MASRQATKSQEDRCVFVLQGDDSALPQPATFRCCPLGVQFHSPKRVPAYQVMRIRLSVPGPKGRAKRITCSGVVVHCRSVNGSRMFRVWVYFLDLRPQVRTQLHRLAKEAELLCPYCENF